jgi:hypothetical protein
MAKWQNDSMLDAAFDWIRARVTIETVCNAQPTTYAEATSTYKLADVPMTSTGISLANGDTNGRKMTVAAKNSVSVDTSGTASHIALAGSTGATILLLVTTCTTQALTSGNTVNIPTWDDEIADAA